MGINAGALFSVTIAITIFSVSSSINLMWIAFIGVSLLLISDIISRLVIMPSELPISAVTALLGTPFSLIYYIKIVLKEKEDILIRVFCNNGLKKMRD